MASLVFRSVGANLKFIGLRRVQHKSFPKLVIPYRSVTTAKPILSKKEYEVTFILPNGNKIKGKGKEGDTLLDVVVNNNLDFDGYGACEGTLTCSTCHVVLKKADYDRLSDQPSEEENDMLDLAYGLTETSRLGCQIQLSEELNGIEVVVPASVHDARS